MRQLLTALPDRDATRRFAEQRYSWRRTADGHYATIEHVLRERRRGNSGETRIMPMLEASGEYA